MGTEVGIEGKISGKHGGCGYPHQHSGQPAQSGQHDGFGQELADYVAPPRANCFADADLVGAFGYRHQHDVHHADAAHQQANRADDDGHQRYRAHDLAEVVGDGFGAGHAEIVGLIEGHIAAAAQQAADLVFGGILEAGIGLGADEMLVVCGVVLAIGVVRNLDGAVGGLILEELSLALLQHADHLVRNAVHQNGFAEAVVSGEESSCRFRRR